MAVVSSLFVLYNLTMKVGRLGCSQREVSRAVFFVVEINGWMGGGDLWPGHLAVLLVSRRSFISICFKTYDKLFSASTCMIGAVQKNTCKTIHIFLNIISFLM